ncbi:hypothetical protein RN001_006022 [Aquatica leii]|uniref:Chromo domain-containing protein n=1 Tax=Aquatica leii TaxID=1421715 RepID=A0AAN7SQ22_9COLE|nr:hypothetical protein RN001_006022 [Aquatica leii]
MAPNDVNDSNILQVWQNLYSSGVGLERIPKYKVGQHVRISRTKQMFEKGYTTNWSEEVFKISEVINRKPPVYRVVDLNREPIEGTFYEEELQIITVNSDTRYKIDKVLKEKGRGINKQYFVKWQGYSDKFNSWVSSNELQQL